MTEKMKVVLTPGPDRRSAGSSDKAKLSAKKVQVIPESVEAGRGTWKERMDKGEEVPWFIRRRFEKKAKKTNP